MRLLEMRGGFLHQHRPDVIPQGYMTDEEIGLWAEYYDKRDREKAGRG